MTTINQREQMKKTILNSILVLGIFLFSGCSIKEYKLFQTETKKEEQTTKITQEDYEKELAYENKIAPNDRLSITVYVQSGQGSQQMSSILTTNSNNNTTSRDDDIGILVTQNGTVRLPMLGSVEIIGLTEDEASAKLIELYKTYIRNPYVKVEIKNQRVIVIGEVKKPGVVSVTNGTMNVLEAIAQSGDLTDLAERNNIKIIRGDLRNPTVRSIDLANIVALNESSLFLRPNDIIYVQPRNLKGYNKAFDEIMPFWNMISSVLDPFVKRRQIMGDTQ
jgi:polysaccharide biosynthesis/export protein